MSNKNVLITGGAGYLGSVLWPLMKMYGWNVDIIDLGWNGFDHMPTRFKGVLYWEENLTDLVRSEFDKYSTIIHLASVSRANLEQEAEGADIENHFKETEYLISKLGNQRLIFASSASVYGNDLQNPGTASMTEEDEPQPICRYGHQKLACEKIILEYGGVCLRMGTLMGPSPLMRNDLVVNAMTKSAIKDKIIKVWGPENARPHLNVNDAARAYMFFSNRPEFFPGVFNIANENSTMYELAISVRREVDLAKGTSTEVITEDRDEPRSYMMNSLKIVGHGFCPRTSVEETVQDLCEYYS